VCEIFAATNKGSNSICIYLYYMKHHVWTALVSIHSPFSYRVKLRLRACMHTFHLRACPKHQSNAERPSCKPTSRILCGNRDRLRRLHRRHRQVLLLNARSAFRRLCYTTPPPYLTQNAPARISPESSSCNWGIRRSPARRGGRRAGSRTDRRTDTDMYIAAA